MKNESLLTSFWDGILEAWETLIKDFEEIIDDNPMPDEEECVCNCGHCDDDWYFSLIADNDPSAFQVAEDKAENEVDEKTEDYLYPYMGVIYCPKCGYEVNFNSVATKWEAKDDCLRRFCSRCRYSWREYPRSPARSI